jgi:hypothetical protein
LAAAAAVPVPAITDEELTKILEGKQNIVDDELVGINIVEDTGE